jgi:hypothetical protein
VKIVEDLVRGEKEDERKDKEDKLNLEAVNTDDENDELVHEAWKLRELKRLKRDKEDREFFEREKDEVDKLHGMTDEERRAYFRANPKVVTNKVCLFVWIFSLKASFKAEKGKYKFLQKYYHRGVFYLDEDALVLKRNVAEPTLEDHFDKTVLPKVMQV